MMCKPIKNWQSSLGCHLFVCFFSDLLEMNEDQKKKKWMRTKRKKEIKMIGDQKSSWLQMAYWFTRMGIARPQFEEF